MAAGLATLLGGRDEIDVTIFDDALGTWDTSPPSIVLADTRCLRAGPWRNGAGTGRHAGSRVVWLADEGDLVGDPAAWPAGVFAALTPTCGEKDVIDLLRGFAEAAPSRLPRAGGPVRGGLAPGALRRVERYVRSHLTRRMTLDELARIAGLSDCHFARAFKQSTGVAPHRYIVISRIAAACARMRTSDDSLTRIGLDVGFCDPSHFSRSFATVMRETPRAYRRRHR